MAVMVLFGIMFSQTTLAFATSSGVERLSIGASGNVGIGNSNPYTKLQVAGIVQINESGETAFDEGQGTLEYLERKTSRFRNTSGGTRAIIDVNSTGVTAGNLSLYNASNAGQQVIYNNAGSSYFNGGNVGIGKTNPAQKLDVNGNIGINGTSNRCIKKPN